MIYNASAPPNYDTLRALLRRVRLSIEAKDIEALHDYMDIAKAVANSGEMSRDLRMYIDGSLKQISSHADHYRLYDADTVADSCARLERTAYGTFTEAVKDLIHDLHGYDMRDGRYSDVYNPTYFDPDDQTLWHEMRAILEKHYGAWNDAADDATHSAILHIRDYMQKYYGPLIPAMNATYRRDQHGVSVRLAWVDETLLVATQAPFVEEIDEYFVATYPIESRRDFTPSVFPKKFAGYTLQDISTANLFEYEL